MTKRTLTGADYEKRGSWLYSYVLENLFRRIF